MNRRTALLLPLTFALACHGEIGSGGEFGDGDDRTDPFAPVEDPTVVPLADRSALPLRRLTDVQFNNALFELYGETDWSREFVALRGLSAHEPTTHFSSDVQTHTISGSDLERYAESIWWVRQQASGIDVDGARLSCSETDSECADRFIDRVGARLYRRPLRLTERDGLRRVYDARLDAGDNHNDALRTVIEALLLSPHFLYLNEPVDEAERAWSAAARLALFLWDRHPDAELRELARTGAILEPGVLDAQARRLVDDPLARPMLHRFYAQLLQLEKPPSRGPGTPDSGPIRDSFADLIDRAHYGAEGSFEALMTLPTHFEGTSMEATYGSHSYPGLLGHPRVPWTHSVYHATAPVQRGVLVIRQLLCQELPPPPPDVEAQLPPPDDTLTNRERFAVHRANPSCAGCHDRIDPIGFGFEAYDQMGRFRTVEGGDLPIDSTGALTYTRDGRTDFDGVAELGAALARSSEAQDCFVEQWATYALGQPPRIVWDGRSGFSEIAGGPDAELLTGLRERFRASGGDLNDLLVALATSEVVLGESLLTDPELMNPEEER